MDLSDKIADYWDRRSSGFSDAVTDEYRNGANNLREKLVSELKIIPGMRILDAGCGPGYFEMLLRDTGAEIHAIDFSEGMVAKATENAPHAKVCRMDVQNMSYPDGYFDAVISRNMFWCLTEPEKAYSELVRVMKPGAKAVIIDANYYRGLFDRNYARTVSPESSASVGNHAKFNSDNVDFREIENLARDMPLSSILRPVWDLGVLCTLPVSEAKFGISSHMTDGFRRIGLFEIIFTKEC